MARIVQMDTELSVEAGQRVLRAEEYQTYLTLQEAQEQANSIITMAQEQAKTIRAEARKEGLAQGLDDATDQVTHKILGLTSDYAKYLEQVEAQLPETVLSMIQQVFSDYTPGEKLAGLTQQSLQKLKQDKAVVVRLSAEDHHDFLERLDVLLIRRPVSCLIETEVDADLKSGQCQIEFEEGIYIVEASTLMEQFEEIFGKVS